MAPFMTHLVVGERVWSCLDDGWRRQEEYGTFLFGCLAPDVDKVCTSLEQGTTHFLPKDEGGAYAWQRSLRLLTDETAFLRAPFGKLSSEEQVFVLGYLCHIATDEISGRSALRIREEYASAGSALPNVDAILTIMDGRFWAMARDPQAIAGALCAAAIPAGALTFAPEECLQAMYQIVLPHVCDGGGMQSYLGMVRRQRQRMRQQAAGGVLSRAEDAAIEVELVEYQRQMEADLEASLRLVGEIDLEPILQEAVDHSCERCERLRAVRAQSRRALSLGGLP